MQQAGSRWLLSTVTQVVNENTMPGQRHPTVTKRQWGRGEMLHEDRTKESSHLLTIIITNVSVMTNDLQRACVEFYIILTQQLE